MKVKSQIVMFGVLFMATLLLMSTLFRAAEQSFFALQPVNSDAVQTPVLILDAGHGGEDGGATGTNGVPEKDLNLSVTQSLAALLRLAGYTVIETRTEDTLLYTEGTPKGHKKQSDLENRLAFTKRYPDSVFISIHMNTFPINTCEGTQVWYAPAHEDSKVWADTVQNKIVSLLQPNNHRKIKASTSSIYLLRHAQTPAILVECGFLSTPAECERLTDAQYRRQLSLAIFAAICEKTAPQS